MLSFKSFNGVSFEWDLTHRSFPRILLDSSNFSRSYSKFHFNVWRKNDLPSVICLSPRSFKILSSLAQPLRFWFFRCASIILGGVSRCHSHHLKTEEEFLFNLALFSSRFMVLACCHPLIIVFDCENLFHPSGDIQESSQFVIRSPSIQVYSFSAVSYHSPILPVHLSNIL